MDAPETTSLGWVGVGRMGRALVMRLLDAGHDVAVYNRTREKVLDLEGAGATIVDSPADLATATSSSRWWPDPPTSRR